MLGQILSLDNDNKYDEIINLVLNKSIEDFSSYEEIHAIGKAFEKKNAFSQCLPWYKKGYMLSRTDEALGMVLGICFALGEISEAEKYLQLADNPIGYYYNAGEYQLVFRKNLGIQAEIEKLEAFIDIQYEESYMMRLANLYVLNGQDKEASKLCRKMARLFINGEGVNYAQELSDQIKNGNGLAYVQGNPWVVDNVFKHLSFDLNAKNIEDVHIEPKAIVNNNDVKMTQPDVDSKNTTKEEGGLSSTIKNLNLSRNKSEKKEEKVKIAPIIEKSLANVIGMEELKLSMNNIFNMMQMNKKRVGDAILKNNIRIYGADGCGKTTAAFAAAKTLSKLGIISIEEPVVTDYDSLVSDQQTTAENIQELFESAENSCILIENIQEFDDGGAYGGGLIAIDLIVKAYYEADEIIPLIITGSGPEVETLLNKKKKFADLFNLPVISVGKYTAEELVQIAIKITEDKNLILDDEVEDYLLGKFKHMLEEPDFKYSRDIDRMINEAYVRQVSRISKKRRPSNEDLYLLTLQDFDSTDSSETVEELLLELDSMTGLTMVKEQVNKIVNQVKIQKMREDMGLQVAGGYGSLHLVFLGNAGTGKTTVARIIGKIYKRLGVLPKGQLVECTRRDLVSEFAGATAQKVADKVKEAMGGILFIDEAYTLCKDDNDTHGREAIDALLTDIENHRDSLMVILAGYTNDMSKFMDQNQGLRSRIPTDIKFEDYTIDEMIQIFNSNIAKSGYILESGIDDDVRKLLEVKSKEKDFGNARGVRNVVEAVHRNQSVRLGKMNPAELEQNREELNLIKKEDLDIKESDVSRKSVDDYLAELNALTGLASVKEQVNKIIASVRVNKLMESTDNKVQSFGTLHMVFKGNAGTGKTTVARIIGGIYKELGVLSTGQLVECDRSALVGQYTGTTAPKVKAKVQEAMGGVLFIDEAYTLATDTFGKEAIDTLVADLENYRDNLMVIIAGYSDDMDDFLQQNQGLSSRFPNTIIFEDYTPDELLTIFKNNINNRGLIISDSLDDKVRQLITLASQADDFGNARGIRNLVDKINQQRSVRLADMLSKGDTPAGQQLVEILSEDLDILDGMEIASKERKTVDDYLAELDSLTGLASVKAAVKELVDLQKYNKLARENNLPEQSAGTLHMVFKGNAGTGKTTVARLLGNIYRELGALSNGQVVECSRSDLVAGYTGQTAMKVKAKVQEAMGGILFIDEAYTLANGGENDFGKEAIDTLVADIENYRNDLMVIIAGYSDDMDYFLAQNQGLSSRFTNQIVFEDYTIDEMVEIFGNIVKSKSLIIDKSLDGDVAKLIQSKMSSSMDFGNARGVRNVVDLLVKSHTQRIVESIGNATGGEKPTAEEMQTITIEDIQKCYVN